MRPSVGICGTKETIVGCTTALQGGGSSLNSDFWPSTFKLDNRRVEFEVYEVALSVTFIGESDGQHQQ